VTDLVPTAPAVPAVPDDVPIGDLLLAGAALHHALERAVYRLRMQGASWADLGRALGVNKSSAYRRWRHLDELRGDVAVEVTDGIAMFVCASTGTRLTAKDLGPAAIDAGLGRVRELVLA